MHTTLEQRPPCQGIYSAWTHGYPSPDDKSILRPGRLWHFWLAQQSDNLGYFTKVHLKNTLTYKKQQAILDLF